MTMMGADDPRLQLVEASSSEWTPDHLARLVSRLGQSSLSCADAVRAVLPLFEGDKSVLRGALTEIAARADRSGTANAFHNPQHSRDVAIIWLNLALANNRLAESGAAPRRLTGHELTLGMCAALGHDVGHDGRSNNVAATGPDGVERTTRVAFRLERVAADCVCDIVRSSGAGESDVATVRAAILATDIVDGYRALEAALGADGAAPRIAGADFAAFRDPAALLIGAILRDADVMPSAGLTARDYDRNTALLETELGLPRNGLGAAAAEDFFGGVLGGRFLSPPGKLFQPRLDALRALNKLRAGRKGSAAVDLATISRDLVDPI